MRFYCGFSKRVPLKWILLIIGGVLAFFGISTINAKALLTDLTPNRVQTCSFDSTFGAANCIDNIPAYCNNSSWGNYSCYETTNANVTLNKRSTWYRYLTNTSSTAQGCNTTGSVSFNLELIMDESVSQNNSQYWTANNSLNYNAWGGTVTRSITKSSRAFHTGYYPYITNWFDHSNLQNTTGVRVYWPRTGGYGSVSCSFVSYGSNWNLNFRCTGIQAKASEYWIGINEYNNNGSSNNGYSRTAIKLTSVSDPCASSSSSSGYNDSGVINAIGEQTSQIVGEFSDLNDNLSDFKSEFEWHESNVAEGLNDINGKLQDSNYYLDGIYDYLTDDSVPGVSNSDLFTHGDHGVSGILTAPIRLVENLRTANSTECSPLRIPINLGASSSVGELPCGSIIWDSVPENIYNLYVVLIFGVIGFGACRRMVKSVHDIFDPQYADEEADLIKLL